MPATINHNHPGPLCSKSHSNLCPANRGTTTCVDDPDGGCDCTHQYNTQAEADAAQATMRTLPGGSKPASY